MTFNGRNIESKVVGRYKDQSNLGTSGKYGYGLLIYDVSDLIYKGQNSLTIKKESGLTAVYPSTLITLYNTTNSNSLKNIIICNNADLLLNSYNLADRPVESVSTINVNLPENISNSTAYIFASSANNGDADLKINNQTYSNIWEQYSNTQHNGVFKVAHRDAECIGKHRTCGCRVSDRDALFPYRFGVVARESQLIDGDALLAAVCHGQSCAHSRRA